MILVTELDFPKENHKTSTEFYKNKHKEIKKNLNILIFRADYAFN
jgi:hypothetical protein